MTHYAKTLTAGAALVLTLAAGLPMAAQAQQQYQQGSSYDGYCYTKKNGAKTTGTVVGAVGGAAVGSQISKNERGLGAVLGAVAGGALGRTIGANSVKCLNGEYYSYQNGYYSPAAAPEGYDVVYYQDRPKDSMYSVVYYDTYRHTDPNYAYNNNGYNNNTSYNNNGGYAYNQGTQGWRDDSGTWHEGRPVAFGWKDSKGRWHEGQLQAYGYKDSSGRWRETSASSYGYNNNGY